MPFKKKQTSGGSSFLLNIARCLSVPSGFFRRLAVSFRRSTVGRMHLFLLGRVNWYSRWHRHPHHRKVHYSALALTCLLVASSIITTLFPNPSGVEAAVATWDFTHDNTKYDYDTNKVSMSGGNASLTNPGSATGSSTNINAASGTTTNTSAQFASANKEYLTIPSNSSLQTGDIDFEIGGWVRFDGINAKQTIAAKYSGISGDVTNREYIVYLETTNKIYFLIGTSSGARVVIANSFGAVTTNTWYYIRAYHNSANSIFGISINGVSDIDTFPLIAASTSTPMTFGKANSASSDYLNGRLDSWYFQKRISTTNEATSLYNAGSGRTYNDLTSANGLDTFKTGLTSWWDFNEEGGTRYDSKGTNHLTSAADPIIAPPVYGSELLSNTGFETAGGGGADVFGTWSEVAGDGAIENETSLVHSGSHAVKIIRGTGSINLQQAFAVTAGASYYLSLWSRGDGTNFGLYGIYDATNLAYIGATNISTNNPTTSYQLITTQFTAPAGCSSIRLYLRGSVTVNGAITYFDDVSVKQITTASINNGGFDTLGAGGADVFGGWEEAVTGSSTINAESANAYTGSYSARFDIDASNSSARIQSSQALLIYRKYTYNITMKSASGTATVSIQDSSGNVAATPTITTTYATYSGTISGYAAYFMLYRGSAANNSIYIDGITIASLGPIANTGIATNSAIDGNFGAGFNGTSQYLSKASNESLQTGVESFEIGGWVYIDKTSTASQVGIIGKETSGIGTAGNEYALRLSSGNVFNLSLRSNNDLVATTFAYPNSSSLNMWHFVRAGYDSVSSYLYISINNSTPTTLAYTGGVLVGNNDFKIGKYASSLFPGRIDGAYKIDRVLNTDEATSLYNNGKGLKYASLPDSIKNDSALKGYWDLDEKTGTRYDSTSNDNDLTDNGTVAQVQGVNYYEGTIGTVNDASGNNNTFNQMTLTKRPAYSQAGINNKPTMVFDGVDDYVEKSSNLLGVGDITITAVINARGWGGNGGGRIIENGVGGTMLYISNTGKIYLSSQGGVGSVGTDNGSIVLGTSYIITATRRSDGIANLYINGILSGGADQASGTPTAGASTTQIGNRAAGDRGFDGSIAGVKIYNGILDPLHRNNIEKALGEKYGITVATDSNALSSSASSSIYPTISLNQSLQYATISSFTPTLSGSSTGIPRYQLTTDSTSAAGSSATASYYYHNGTNWLSANKYNAYQSNTASEIDANIATLKNDVPSGGANFVKWRAFLITDGVDNPSITSINSNYISDTKAPTNPTSIVSTITPLDSATPQTIATNEWHNSKTLHLTWPASRNQSDPETEASRGGAIDQINENEIYSGVAGYNLYFGEDPSADPTSTSGLINANSSPYYQAATTIDLTNLPLESGKTYYFLIETKDLAGNIAHVNQRALEEPPVLDTPLFVYKYDLTSPAQVDYVNVSPVGCSTASSFDFSWTAASDTYSQLAGYEYKTGLTGEVKSTANTTVSSAPYRDDENVFYVRSKDIAGNTTANWQSAVYCSTGGTYILDGPNTTVDISSFQLTWTSSKPTTSIVKVYDQSNAEVANKSSEELTQAHNIKVDGLKPGSTYTYQITWKDAHNNPGETERKELKTQRISIIDGPTIQAGPSSIEVSWVSSQPTTSYVQVFDGNTYVSEQGRTEFVQSHKVSIAGLKPEKTYRYRPIWTDQFGNIDQGEWGETATETSPRVYDLSSNIISPTSVIVSWKTNYSSNTILKYGIGSFTENISIPGSSTSFSQQLNNIKPDRNYQVGVDGSTPDGSVFTSGITFITPPLPAISALRFEPLKDTSHATYKAFWTTNIETSSAIFYKVQGGGDYKSKASAELTKVHEILLDSMEDQVTYELYAQSTDSYGNVVKSDLNTIKTPNDSRPPKITNLSTSVKSSGFADNQKAQVIVTWDTDELSTSQVEYANGIEGTEYQNRTKEEASLSTSHVVVISDLEPSKIYHLRAISKDQASNPSYSTDTTVITGKVQKSVLDIILASLQRSLGWITKLFR